MPCTAICTRDIVNKTGKVSGLIKLPILKKEKRNNIAVGRNIGRPLIAICPEQYPFTPIALVEILKACYFTLKIFWCRKYEHPKDNE